MTITDHTEHSKLYVGKESSMKVLEIEPHISLEELDLALEKAPMDAQILVMRDKNINLTSRKGREDIKQTHINCCKVGELNANQMRMYLLVALDLVSYRIQEFSTSCTAEQALRLLCHMIPNSAAKTQENEIIACPIDYFILGHSSMMAILRLTVLEHRVLMNGGVCANSIKEAEAFLNAVNEVSQLDIHWGELTTREQDTDA